MPPPPEDPRVARLISEKEDLNRRIFERDKTIDSLQKQLAAAQRTASKATDALAAEQARTSEEKAQSEAATSDLRSRLTEAEKRVAVLSTSLERSEGAEGDLRRQLDATTKHERDLEHQLSDATNELQHRRSSMSATETEMAERRKQQASSNESARDANVELSADCNRLHAALIAAKAAERTADDTCKSFLKQMTAERELIGKQLDLAHQRIDTAMVRERELQLERERSDEAVAVALADVRSLSSEAERTQVTLQHERTTLAAAWRELDVVRAEMSAERRRREALDREHRAQQEHARAIVAQRDATHDANEKLERERQLLVEACCRQEAFWRLSCVRPADGSAPARHDPLLEWTRISRVLDRLGMDVAPLHNVAAPSGSPPPSISTGTRASDQWGHDSSTTYSPASAMASRSATAPGSRMTSSATSLSAQRPMPIIPPAGTSPPLGDRLFI